MSTQAKVALSALVLAALAATAAFWPRSAAPATLARPPAVPAALIEPPGALSEGVALAQRSVPEREAEAVGAQDATLPEVEAALTELRGRVVDVEMRPLAGLEVGIRSGHSATGLLDEPRARSAADGSFSLFVQGFSGSATLVSPVWVALFEPAVGPKTEDAVLLVAAPAVRVAGHVVDPADLPIEGAELDLLIPDELRKGFPAMLDGASPVERSARTDGQGSFELVQVPTGSGMRVRARRQGFETALVAVPSSSRDDFMIVLAPPRIPDAVLRGLVVDPAGAVVREAFVALGDTGVRTDASGSFALNLEQSGVGRVLIALKPGHLPARLECAAASPRAPGAWPEPLVLRLGGPPLAIAGLVLDELDKPVPGALVSVVERTYFGKTEIRFGTDLMLVDECVEALLNRDLNPHYGSGCVRADEHGRFRLQGLLARDYSLQAYATQTLAYGLERAVEAGREDVVLRLKCGSGLGSIHGRVLTRQGAPIEGALVVPQRKILRWAEWGESTYEVDVSGAGASTDEQGRFELAGACREIASLLATHGDSQSSVSVQLSSLGSTDDIAIVMPLRCHLQVDLEGSQLEVNGLRVLDAKDERLNLTVYHGNVSYGYGDFYFDGRKTEAFVVSEDAATLVLLKGNAEVQRIPLYLRPDELNVIRP